MLGSGLGPQCWTFVRFLTLPLSLKKCIFLFIGGTGLPTLGGIGGRGGNVSITCKEQVYILIFIPVQLNYLKKANQDGYIYNTFLSVFCFQVESLLKIRQNNPSQRYVAGFGENSRQGPLSAGSRSETLLSAILHFRKASPYPAVYNAYRCA